MQPGRIGAVILLASSVAFGGCASRQEKARELLGRMNITYNEETFLDRVKDGDTVVVGAFLTSGMDPAKAFNKEGKPALVVAAEAGKLDVARLLLDRGISVDTPDKKLIGTPLVWAAARGHEDVVKLLVERGAKVPGRELKTGKTGLIAAAFKGDEAIARYLLDKGAPLNDIDMDGRTALMYAAQNGQTAIAKLLIERGADIKIKASKNGVDALTLAAGRGQKDVVALLVDKGADVNAIDNDGRSALMWAARHGTAETVQLLLDRGANVRAKANAGDTVMSAARDSKKPDVEAVVARAEAGDPGHRTARQP